MNKKILLSTILASSILLTSQSAMAAGAVTYNRGAYSFSFNGTSYTDPALLEQAIRTAHVVPSFAPTQIQDFVVDLLTGSNTPAKQNVITNIAAISEDLFGEVVTTGEINQVLQQVTQALNANIFTQTEVVNFVNLLSTGSEAEIFEALEEAGNILGQAAAFQPLASQAQSNLATVENNIATNNPTLSNLLTQQTALKGKTTKTADDDAALSQLHEEIFSLVETTSEFIANRNSAQNQEALKQALNIIQAIKNSDLNDAQEKELIEKIQALLGDSRAYIATNTTNNSSLPAVQKSDAQTTGGIMSASLANAGVLNDRIGGFAGGLGVASGDVFQTFGAWIQGNFGVGQQKAFKKESGYKFNQKGVTIGFDTGDESLIGVAYSYFKNDVTNKTASSAKDKIDTNIGSIYGKYVINPEFFVSGQFSYGKSKIKKSRKTGDLANNTATAKTSGTTMGGRAEFGYVYAIDNVTQVVPTIGFASNRVAVKGYTEKGSGLNRTVGKRTSNRNSGLAGVTLRHIANMESIKVMPEIHANIDYAFNGKNSATNISLANGLITTSTPSEKVSKMYFNLGTSVKLAGINSNMIDVSAGYDLGLAKKFISHTGALKLKVNFQEVRAVWAIVRP